MCDTRTEDIYMKKIIVVFLLCALLFPMLPRHAFAKNTPQITSDDVSRMVREVFLLINFYCGYTIQDVPIYLSLYVDKEDTANIVSGSSDLPTLVFERSVRIAGNIYGSGSYENFEYKVGTRTELLAFMMRNLTDKAANELFSVLANDLMAVRVKNGDNLYVRKDKTDINPGNLYGYRIDQLLGVKSLKVSGDSATAVAVIECGVGYMNIPLSLERVNGEWRISENFVFTRVYAPDYKKYVVKYSGMNSPLSPDLTEDTLSDESINWLIRSSNALFLDLGAIPYPYYIYDSNAVSYNVTTEYKETIEPYADSDLPQHIIKRSFSPVKWITLQGTTDFFTTVSNEAEFFSFISGVLTENAARDYVDVITNRMYALYFADGKVYQTNHSHDRTYLPIIQCVNKVKSITYTEDGAIAEIELLSAASFELDPIYTTLFVKFEKTADGWRMAENIYGRKIYEELVDELPEAYRDPVPDLFPLPDLSSALTKEGAMMAAERAYQVAELFNYQSVHRMRIIGEMENGRYGSDAYKNVTAFLENGLYSYYPHDEEEYGKYDYYHMIVNKNRDVDFIGKRLTCVADVDALISEFATGRAKECLKLFYSGEPVFIDCDDGTLRTQPRDRYVGSRIPYLLDFGAFNINGNTATLEVTMGIMYLDSNEQGEPEFFVEPKQTTVTFAKTKDGWRISGGTMFSLLYGDTFSGYGPLPSPETADSTPIVVSVALLSLAVCGYTAVKKRKV